VTGGKPLVTRVDFSCPGYPDVSPDASTSTAISSSISIRQASGSQNGNQCVCFAQWKMVTMYQKDATVELEGQF
jgi:hypothetical protein